MSDATFYAPASPVRLTAGAAIPAYELRQLANGLAGYLKRANSAAIGDSLVPFDTGDQITLAKTTGMCFLDGGPAYWDFSASACHYKQVDDQDFAIGSFVGDAALNDTSCTVNLNVAPRYKIDVSRDPFITAIIGTQALGGLALLRRGGAHDIVIDASNEAQKVDILSMDGFSIDSNPIVEFDFDVPSDGAGTVVDVNVGVANTTHASNADSITRYLFMHLDANATAIKFQSTDGSTTVAATDSTKTYTEGQTVVTRKTVWMDFRNKADVQIYVDGVNVLPATVFDLSAVAATMYLLCHVEKSASTDTYEFLLGSLRARTAKQ